MLAKIKGQVVEETFFPGDEPDFIRATRSMRKIDSGGGEAGGLSLLEMEFGRRQFFSRHVSCACEALRLDTLEETLEVFRRCSLHDCTDDIPLQWRRAAQRVANLDSLRYLALAAELVLLALLDLLASVRS